MAARTSTTKDYHERVNKVIRYIHNHLDEKLDIRKLAEYSALSPFHFHRIMRAHLNESLVSYIIRLRLDTAANLLLHSGLSVNDIAYKVGYDVPSSFNKAFKKRFKVTPTRFKAEYDDYKIDYLSNMKKPKKMNLKAEIKKLEPKKVIYVSSIGPYEGKGTEMAWEKVCRFAEKRRLFLRDTEFIGISHDDPKITESEKLRYDACLTINKDVAPEGEIGAKTIPGGTYAVFLHKGPYEKLIDTYDYIYGVWLPESGQELREEPCFENYLNSPDKTPPENLRTEIFVPLK
jgi:AraC family transcriptional regulator